MSDGANVALSDVADAPDQIPDDVDMLVVGGPTHAVSMSRLSTRRDAVRHGGAEKDLPRGVREWLEGLSAPKPGCTFAAFDTRVDMPLLPGAASHSATRLAKKRGFVVVEPASFLVAGYEGPLLEGQLEHARDWGHGLTEQLAG